MEGYGMVYQSVTRNKAIPAGAKGLYAYLASLCGAAGECYPSVDTIISDMDLNRETFYRYVKILVAAGVVTKRQEMGRNGKFGRVIYRLTDAVSVQPCTDLPKTENPYTEIPSSTEPYAENPTKKSNRTKINIITSIAENYNAICVSYPRMVKMSEARKKAITARLNNGYSEGDFRRLFELAEQSSFLKGGNERNWRATFDWLVADRNMAKVLDGNYADRPQNQAKGDNNDEKYTGSTSSVRLW